VLWQAPQAADKDGIAAFQHMSESAGLALPVAEGCLAVVASLQVPAVRLGREAACTHHCEEAAQDTHEPDGQQDQALCSDRAADDRDTAAVGSSPVPWVGVVAGRAFADDRALESPHPAGIDVAENMALAVVGTVPAAACLVVDHGACSESLEEAQHVATSSCQVVEVAPALVKKKPGWMHWGSEDCSQRWMSDAHDEADRVHALEVVRAACRGWRDISEGCQTVAIAVPFLTTEGARCWTMFGDALRGRPAAPVRD